MPLYKFDSLKGRISGKTNSIPEGLTANIKEPAQLIWSQKPHRPAPGFWDDYPKNTIKKYQALFQKPDGLPVHLKRGFRDKGMYAATMGLTIFGSIYACYVLYGMSFKKE